MAESKREEFVLFEKVKASINTFMIHLRNNYSNNRVSESSEKMFATYFLRLDPRTGRKSLDLENII